MTGDDESQNEQELTTRIDELAKDFTDYAKPAHALRGQLRWVGFDYFITAAGLTALGDDQGTSEVAALPPTRWSAGPRRWGVDIPAPLIGEVILLLSLSCGADGMQISLGRSNLQVPLLVARPQNDEWYRLVSGPDGPDFNPLVMRHEMVLAFAECIRAEYDGLAEQASASQLSPEMF